MKPFENDTIQQATPQQNKDVYSKPIKLWEPEAVSFLSLLLTPIFGTILHAINWNKLKNNEMLLLNLAAMVGYFIVLSVASSFATYLLYYHTLETHIDFRQTTLIFTHLVAWFVWHRFLASTQIKLLKEQKMLYIKRNLWIPILIIAGIPLLFAIAFVIWLTTVVF